MVTSRMESQRLWAIEIHTRTPHGLTQQERTRLLAAGQFAKALDLPVLASDPAKLPWLSRVGVAGLQQNDFGSATCPAMSHVRQLPDFFHSRRPSLNCSVLADALIARVDPLPGSLRLSCPRLPEGHFRAKANIHSGHDTLIV